jgi:hypothetical protein
MIGHSDPPGETYRSEYGGGPGDQANTSNGTVGVCGDELRHRDRTVQNRRVAGIVGAGLYVAGMSNQPSPHDALFRRVLGQPAHASSQLRAVLPAALVGRLDLDRLTPAPDSFVDATLQWRHCDVLFTAPLDGREAFVYMLVEHQSPPGPADGVPDAAVCGPDLGPVSG